MNIKSIKNSLREDAKNYRKHLSDSDRILKSKQIHKNLRNVSAFCISNDILIYASLPGEVETLSLIQELLEENKLVYCPKIDKEHMYFYQIHSLADLKEGSFHVLEPCPTSNMLLIPNPKTKYCMIVPGLMFDQTGNRLGYGKGFYDKYLAMLSPQINMTTIAFSYNSMVKKQIPAEETDQRTDYVITEKQIYQCTHTKK